MHKLGSPFADEWPNPNRNPNPYRNPNPNPNPNPYPNPNPNRNPNPNPNPNPYPNPNPIDAILTRQFSSPATSARESVRMDKLRAGPGFIKVCPSL